MVPVRSEVRSVLLLVLVHASYSLSIALTGRSPLGPWWGLALSGAGTTIAGWVYCRAVSARPHRLPARQLIVFFALSVLQVSAYVVAVSFGPVAICAALHLCAPVLYLVEQVGRGGRRFGAQETSVGGLLLLALGMIAATGTSGGENPATVGVALVLSAVSGVALAVLLRKLAVWTGERDMRHGIWQQSAVLAALGVPVSLAVDGAHLPVAHVGWTAAIVTLPVAMVFASALQWKLLAQLPPMVYGSVPLSEVGFTALFTLMIFGDAVQGVHVLAAALVLAAVAIEVRRPYVPATA